MNPNTNTPSPNNHGCNGNDSDTTTTTNAQSSPISRGGNNAVFMDGDINNRLFDNGRHVATLIPLAIEAAGDTNASLVPVVNPTVTRRVPPPNLGPVSTPLQFDGMGGIRTFPNTTDPEELNYRNRYDAVQNRIKPSPGLRFQAPSGYLSQLKPPDDQRLPLNVPDMTISMFIPETVAAQSRPSAPLQHIFLENVGANLFCDGGVPQLGRTLYHAVCYALLKMELDIGTVFTVRKEIAHFTENVLEVQAFARIFKCDPRGFSKPEYAAYLVHGPVQGSHDACNWGTLDDLKLVVHWLKHTTNFRGRVFTYGCGMYSLIEEYKVWILQDETSVDCRSDIILVKDYVHIGRDTYASGWRSAELRRMAYDPEDYEIPSEQAGVVVPANNESV